MAVPLQSDVPTFVAPAHEQLAYVPGSIVVGLHEDTSEPFDYLRREAGAHTLESLDDNLRVVEIDEHAVSPQLLRTVESSPAVAFAERMPARWLSVDQAADPRHNRQWGLRAIRWFDAATPDAAAVTVAICDTGVDERHPDLAAAIASYDHEGASADDIVGHGTHVSGIVAGRNDDAAGVVGVAGCRVAMWKVFPDQPNQGNFYVDGTAFLRALNAVATSGAKVLNLSLGGTQSSQAEQLLFERLERAGVTVVAAMGNEHDHGNPVEYPAAYDHVLAVGAVAETNRRSPFSNTGPHIGIAAPGSNVLSTLPTKPSPYRPDTAYASWSGTSMATPHVSAAAALVAAQHPDWTPADTKEHLRARAAKVADMDGQSFTEGFGSGLLDIASLAASD
ncbi:MAG TPA: S8 family serine peptidase [Gaiellaceae bacterium]|nr:S8 family serine peptidase [Gaiellaceae bacterium]